MNTDRQVNRQATAESIQRIASGLRTGLRVVGLSNRACERELGLSTGYLTRILAGQVQLRVAHVLDLCQMLDLPPAAFFSALFPPSQTSETTARLLRGLNAVHTQSPSSRTSLEDLLLQLRGTVQELERMA